MLEYSTDRTGPTNEVSTGTHVNENDNPDEFPFVVNSAKGASEETIRDDINTYLGTQSRTGYDPAAVTSKRPHPAGYASGLQISYVSATTVRISKGCCRSYDDGINIDSTGNLDADITVSGAGGLDTGSEASDTLYAIHVAFGSEGKCALLSLSATAPTLPAGYDWGFRRRGWMLNGSDGDIVPFDVLVGGAFPHIRYMTTIGDRVAVAGGTATTETALDVSAFVPSTAQSVEVQLRSTQSAAAGSVNVGSNDGSLAAAVSAVGRRPGFVGATSNYDGPQLVGWDGTNISYLVLNATLWAYDLGYIDNLEV